VTEVFPLRHNTRLKEISSGFQVQGLEFTPEAAFFAPKGAPPQTLPLLEKL
jgi:hypothetical protein